jgi:hypothetical protein
LNGPVAAAAAAGGGGGIGGGGAGSGGTAGVGVGLGGGNTTTKIGVSVAELAAKRATAEAALQAACAGLLKGGGKTTITKTSAAAINLMGQLGGAKKLMEHFIEWMAK